MPAKRLIINITVCFIVLMAISSKPCISQNVNRDVAVSAYLYNFSKNITWDNEDSIDKFQFLILGDSRDVYKNISKMSETYLLRGKKIIVQRSADIISFENIHLIYLSPGFDIDPSLLYDMIESKNTLLVTDNYGDQSNIMINFIDHPDGSLKFEINNANIINQHLKVSPDIILLGGTEVDVAELYFKGQQNLREQNKQFKELQQDLESLKQSNKTARKELNLIRDSLNMLNFKILEQHKIFNTQTGLLQLRETELENKKHKIKEQEDLLTSLQDNINIQKSEIQQGEEILQVQQAELEETKQEIENKSNELNEQKKITQRQRNYMNLLGLLTVMFIFLIIVIYNNYKIKHKLSRELESKVRKRTNELNILNAELESRVEQRTIQLTTINKELESFSYSISHDLRAPLRAVYGFSQILANRHRESLNQEGREYMNYVVQASRRMEQLIDDLLNYSRLGRKALNLKPVDLNEILEEMQIEFNNKIHDIGGEITIERPLPVIIGDVSLTRQIFINLIDNSIKYRSEDVKLLIKIFCEYNDRELLIKVSDNGIGIAEEYFEKIFNIFQRLHSEEEFPGTGIGLASVKKSVEMMLGSISLTSVPGKGTTFIIKLPNK